ncbi:MAG: ABC transporter ATP-binding protein [Rectinemataceae bacterium]
MFEILSVSMRFESLEVLDRISFSMASGSITAVVGPSGSGKTTLLNIVAGLLLPDSGSLSGFENKRFSYCFQDPRLLPWLSAKGNVMYALSGLDDSTMAEQRCMRFLKEAGLAGFEHYKPPQLSGGMQKRLALARAFAMPADVLLLDEAFTAVDFRQKQDLMRTFLDLWQKEKPTVLMVTHDIHDALSLADQIVVFSDRPAHVEGIVNIPVSREQRSLGAPALAPAEQELFNLLGI